MDAPVFTTDKSKLLDLFCKAGGAGMGYHRAGFEVIGVDIEPQKRYPFQFVQADALEYAKQYGHLFDAIHASPPCQGYSNATSSKTKSNYPLLIPQVRQLLKELGKLYVIENVENAKSAMENPLMLCGSMFDLQLVRHRLFETNPPIYFPPTPCYHWRTRAQPKNRPGGSLLYAKTLRDDQFLVVVGNGHAPLHLLKKAMGIDWMNAKELCQAIPPAYTEFIGKALLAGGN